MDNNVLVYISSRLHWSQIGPINKCTSVFLAGKVDKEIHVRAINSLGGEKEHADRAPENTH